MVTNVIQGEGVQAYTVELNVLECNTIRTLGEKAVKVVKSHKKDSKKKLYFSDEDYERVIQVCFALTREMKPFGNDEISSFNTSLVIGD